MICADLPVLLKFLESIDTAKWGAIGSILGGIAAMLAVFIAWFQLRNLNDSLKTSNITAILQMEAELNERKVALDRFIFDVAKRKVALKRLTAKRKQEEVDLIEREYKTTVENYLNIIDRLCALIAKGHLRNVIDWKDEYGEQVVGLMKTFDEELGEKSPYRNIRRLAQKWKDGQ